MPKKLTSTQISNLRTGTKRLFDRKEWLACLPYLYATRKQDDPTNPEHWNHCCLLIRLFIDYVLQQVRIKYGQTAHDCLVYASQPKCGIDEKAQEHIHLKADKPCIFCGSVTLPLYVTREKGAQPTPTSQRVHIGFYYNDYHQQTGVHCPHFTPLYVYDSHYSNFVYGMYALGHFQDTIRALAKSETLFEGNSSIEEFKSHVIWQTVWDYLNAIVEIMIIYITCDVIETETQTTTTPATTAAAVERIQ